MIEGTGGNGNIDSLRAMSRASRNPLLHFFPVNGVDHFSVLDPATRFLARKVLDDNGPSANSLFQPAELQRAFRH